MSKRVEEIEFEIAELKERLGTSNNPGEISWKVDRLEYEKGKLLRREKNNAK